ncbi:MAG TPA: response regulator [Candidatus Acidoferrales bacterium]|nr:response regulator [Candidatus Acidoferrales bacterium]
MSETKTLTAARTPTVYFIDDSATMREVIKIAFRKENIHVVTCPDARSALAQFHETAPDAVITDVIMPDQDGYEVCEFIKQHEQFGRTPVILMSGVVNKTVAERAMAVKADELVRKPFQPQELIARVKNLLNPRPAGTGDSSTAPYPSRALTSLFAPHPSPVTAPVVSRPSGTPGAVPTPPAVTPRAAASSAEVQKLRTEILRLELLVKKLEASLDAEREYCVALEAHLKALQHS